MADAPKLSCPGDQDIEQVRDMLTYIEGYAESADADDPVHMLLPQYRAAVKRITTAPNLAESVSDLLKMVEAAHRQLGMWTNKNPRIVKAKAALVKAGLRS